MKWWASGLGVGMATLATTAAAVDTPPGGSHNDFEAVALPAVRPARTLSWFHAPRPTMAAGLGPLLGSGTRIVWDRATAVPARIWGAGISVPDSVANPAVAAAYAQSFLDSHIAKMVAGSTSGHFDLVSNDLDAGMRTVGFRQRVGGMLVVGGQVSFRFKADRLMMVGCEALPDVDQHLHSDAGIVISQAGARAAAAAWLVPDVAASAQVVGVDVPAILPLISHRSVRYHTVYEVVATTSLPDRRWHVFVDAQSGEVVAHRQSHRFATASLDTHVPVRWPGGQRADYPAQHMSLTVDGSATTTDAAGAFTWPTNNAGSVVAEALGTFVTVENVAGPDVQHPFVAVADGMEIWDASADEHEDAQLNVFTHVNLARSYVRNFASLSFLDEVIPTRVNIDNACNAFYGNGGLNFYASSQNCSNTGRLADVVYHELGHMLHDNAIIDGVGAMDGALSEGVSDYLAATITGDSAMGPGFFKSSSPLREIDPDGVEHRWPDDIGEIHHTGLIIGGTLWDLRTLLIADHGEAQGIALADALAYQAQRRAIDIPTMYFEVLAADDDDGNLDNGTPNQCAIQTAFGRHGLREIPATVSDLSVQPPFAAGYEVSVRVEGLTPTCLADTTVEAALHWRDRSNPMIAGMVPMLETGSDEFAAEIPPQLDGTVVQYRVEILLGDDTLVAYPKNPADPHFEMFVGHTEPIYCTDFEQDPALDGWTHGLTSGTATEGADDWQWGVPNGNAGSRDPAAAFSGTQVFGNDLGAENFNGKYQGDKVNFATSPSIDVSGYEVVRLQYRRWLSIEDGYFDQAIIYSNGTALWGNRSSGNQDGATHHVDSVWRFHDVELTATRQDDAVAVTFELNSDGGLELGGWTLDDLCVVGWIPTVCGDGKLTGLEQCDDGADNSDTQANACRSTCEPASCGDGVVDAAELCDDGNTVDGDGCDSDCGLPPEGPDDGMPDPGAGGSDGDEAPFVVVDDGCACRLGDRSGDRRGREIVWLGLLGVLLRRRRRAARVAG